MIARRGLRISGDLPSQHRLRNLVTDGVPADEVESARSTLSGRTALLLESWRWQRGVDAASEAGRQNS